MNVSSINCTPIKPQASFGSESKQDAQKILDLTGELKDEFQPKNPEKKSIMQTVVSVLGVLASTYVIGKYAAAKTLQISKKVAPQLLNNTGAFVKKMSNNVKTDVEKVINSEKSGKFAKSLGKRVLQGGSIVKNKVAGMVEKNGVEEVIKNAAGVASVVIAAPKILTVDGNGDGYADIGQKNINAYQNAVRKADIFADILSTIS